MRRGNELTEKVRNGECDGLRVWICDFNKPDLEKKALRNVKPTYVEVVSNDDLPVGKRVYYSKSHYVAVSKNGTLSSKVISPVDNTGYRSNFGNMLFTFTCEDECRNAWSGMISLYIERLEKKKLSIVDLIQGEIDELKSMS
ncbi:MAG: hypothetical protein ACRCVV_14620 [Shewanella sp.]|uniref:hypothetical protein n=1 Tax=Aeromonas popoffii TaxID=70856 RepID=UPI003F3055DF